MSKQIQRRRGSAANHAGFTGAAGEITIDTTNNRLILHDGILDGGHTGVKRADIFTNGYPALSDASGQLRLNADSNSTNIVNQSNFNIISNTVGATNKTTVISDGSFTHVKNAIALFNSDATIDRNHAIFPDVVIRIDSGNVMLGRPSLVSTSVSGHCYIPLVTGIPTTNPQSVNGFCPIAINTGNMRLYVHNNTGKWWFASLTST